MKEEKVKTAGSAEELANLFAKPKLVTAHVARVTGEGKDRVVEYDSESVAVAALPVSEIGHYRVALEKLSACGAPGDTYFALAVHHPEEGFAVVAAGIDWPIDRVGALHPASFFELFDAVLAANFFVRLLAPLSSVAQATTEEIKSNGAGAAPLSTSEAADTTSPSATH